MFRAGDMIVLSAGKYLFVWNPILCWIGMMLVTDVVVGQASCYVRNVPNRAIRFAVHDCYIM